VFFLGKSTVVLKKLLRTCLDPVTGLMTRYQHSPVDVASLSSNYLNFTLEDKDGTFWVATTEGLDVLDRTTGKFTRRIPRRPPGGPILSGKPLLSLLFKSMGRAKGRSLLRRSRKRMEGKELRSHLG
jgi:hypothetical protein